jgi:hypothetical protein
VGWATQEGRGEAPLRKNDAVNDMDDTVAGFDICVKDV